VELVTFWTKLRAPHREEYLPSERWNLRFTPHPENLLRGRRGR